MLSDNPRPRAINGGSIATHEDCSEQRQLSRQLASTKQFLESVLENIPVCVAAKNIEDGRYIFANRAFERFSRFSRDNIVGKRADEIFRPGTAASIEAAAWHSARPRMSHSRKCRNYSVTWLWLRGQTMALT